MDLSHSTSPDLQGNSGNTGNAWSLEVPGLNFSQQDSPVKSRCLQGRPQNLDEELKTAEVQLSSEARCGVALTAAMLSHCHFCAGSGSCYAMICRDWAVMKDTSQLITCRWQKQKMPPENSWIWRHDSGMMQEQGVVGILSMSWLETVFPSERTR